MAPAQSAAQTATEAPASDALRALGEWLTLYRGGKLDVSMQDRMRGRVNQARAFVSVKHGLVSERELPRLDHVAELRLLCAAVARADDARAAAALLDVAAVGLDDHAYTAEMAPATIRRIGEEFAGKLSSRAALDEVVRLAVHGTGAARGSLARQAASLRVLGRGAAAPHAALLQAALAHAEPVVRLGAADALVHARLPACVGHVAGQLRVEADERVAVRLLDALTATLGTAGEGVDAAARAGALEAALAALAQHGWRVQLAACDTLAVARSARSVPGLIYILDRYHGNGAKAVTSKGSHLVPARAHELLRDLTGAVFGADRPDQWRQWWAGAAATFTVAAAPAVDGGRLQQDGAATSAATFFGVPVTGTRVTFVVDTSGSMAFEFVSRTETTARAAGGLRTSKWEAACRELQRALEALPAGSSFNVVYFSLGADAWKPKPVAASPANRKAFLADLARRRPGGGTDLWAALRVALGLRRLGYGDPPASDVDEVFLLSDGAPSQGDVVDPRQILDLVRAGNEINRVRIHSIYIGGDEGGGRGGPRFGMDGLELMRRLAGDSGGKFVRP